MPAQAEPGQVSQFQMADEDEGRMRQVIKGIESKTDEGATRVEGYVATQGLDRAGDVFTEEALQEMADQINEEIDTGNAKVKAVFPEFDEEDLKQIKQSYTNNGNVDHYNNPGYPMGDPRIVSAYKVVSAEYDGFGVKIEAELNENLPFGVSEAIKAGLQEGYLDGFSVEFIAKKARKVVRDGKRIREILSAKFTGASLTGRPIQGSAAVTDAEFKSMVGEFEEAENQGSKSFIKGLEEMVDEKMDKQEVKALLEDIAEEKAENITEEKLQEFKNDITGDTMPEEQEQDEDPEPEDGEGQDNVEEQEGKSAAEELREELSEVRQEIKSVVDENEQLQEEKEEMEQKFDNLDEDLEGIQEVKSEIDELKQELKNVTPDNAPEQDTGETRDQQVSEQETKSALEQQLEAYSNPRRVIESQDMKSAIADRHGVTEEDVEEKANELAA